MPEQAARSSADRRVTARRPREEREPRTGRDHLKAPQRRTVVIRGQVADRYGPTAGRARSRSYRGMPVQPERAALWAVLLGLALVIAALASSHM
jgi:hypothetical protein